MHYRPLGKTGLPVSEIGYGAWGIGGSMWIGAQEDESVRALHRAIELGVNFIDTARGYGDSERERNATVGDGRGLSAERQAIVAKHRWERNFYES